MFEGKTTGTPILMLAHNKDVKSKDYNNLKDLYRPSHADFTYDKKYGHRDWRGGGHASARETLARVAAGLSQEKCLRERHSIEFLAYVEQVGEIKSTFDYRSVTPDAIEDHRPLPR